MMFVMVFSAVYAKGGGDSSGGGSGGSSSGSNSSTEANSSDNSSGFTYDSKPDGSVDVYIDGEYSHTIYPKKGGGSGDDGEDALAAAEAEYKAAKSRWDSIKNDRNIQPEYKKNVLKDIANAQYKLNQLQAQSAGDPVLLTSGQYFQTDTDITLKTFSSLIPVNRFYVSGGSTGGGILGCNWTSSVEMRLIRGISIGADRDAANMEAVLETLKSARAEVDSKAAGIGSALKQDYQNFTLEAEACISETAATAAELRAVDARKKQLDALNKYAKYGNAADFAGTGNDTLILMLEGYKPVVFDYKGSGTWEPHEAEYKGNYTIKSTDGKDALETAGFILSYRNGSEKRFNRWGLSESEKDSFGNVTLYNRDGNQQLSSIESSTGQSLVFSYNGDGLVTKIELYDSSTNTGHCVAYTYEGTLLSSVTDIDGDESRFEYNSDKNLVKLVKSDGSFVEFRYGLMDKDGNLLTTQTVNEEGFSERFDYDRTNRKTAYTDHDGVRTLYTYNENHKITQEVLSNGTTVSYTYDGAGRTTSRTVNGSTTNYTYNPAGDLLEARYADGSSERYTYDEKGNCLSYKDRDGIITEFVYNTTGSCTAVKKGGVEVISASYNPKGLLTDIYKNGSHTVFSYDTRGNLTERRTGSVSEKWTYDNQNRVTEYIDGEGQKYTYNYTQKTVTEKTPAGLERVYTTNGRKDIISIEETDTQTGEKRIFSYEYDKRHLVTGVKAGSSLENLETVVSYTYTKAGKALSETRTDENASWITEYVYDTAGRIESVKRSKTDKYGQAASQPVTQKYEYTNTANGMDFTSVSPEGNRTVVSYDRWNRVTDIKNALNEKSQRSLSSAGRTLREQSSHGGNYVYGYDRAGNLASLGEENKKQVKVVYNPDGSIRNVTDRLGNITTFEYDEQGLLAKEISPSGTTVYTYDNVGRVKTVLVGSGSSITKSNATQYVEYEYSDNGRTVKLIYGGLYETTYNLTAWGEVVAVSDGAGNSRKYEYDSIGRTKAFYDGYGEKTEYDYNAVGRIEKITYPDGTYRSYEYNELYQVTKATDGEGTFFEGTYNRDGLLIAEKARPGIDKEYRYDKLGRIVEVKTGGDVTEKYSYTTKGRTVTFTDGKGSDYVYSYDEFGRLVAEKNRLDGVQNYTYNENADFAGKKDFEGNMTAVSYDSKTRTKRTQYADGTESVIVYDACGNILSATNESGTVTYIYNKAGKLIKQTDGKTGDTLNYTYDKAGRRTRLSNQNRDITYTYGKNGEILSQKDTKQNLAVSYIYDKCGRETERRFANGVVQKTRYDKAGRTVSIAQYAKNGNLISGEAYVYDEQGRRSHTVSDKGFVTIYKYDNQSRLQTVYYPFNDDIKETARKEADKQGLYFLPSQGNPENYFLSTSEMVKLRAAAENLARARGNAITVNQVVWKESYTYDANGNRTSKTTVWGTVAYCYDKENRLVESGNLGKSESVKYTYDKNGNLLRESAARYRKDYTYNAQNRMNFSDVQDSVLNTRNFTEYEYDAFGRRVETKEYLGDYTRNLYDGFSFDIIGKSVLQGSYPMALPEQKYRTPNRQTATSVTDSGTPPNGRNERGTDIGTRYRYIDDNPLVPIPESGSSSSTSTTTAKTRSRPNNEYVLYSYGEPVAINNDNGTSYFGSDILGSVRSVTDKYGTVQTDYSYDAFGSPYLGNIENDIGFGYCGKVYDVGTGLYDYGFRDYSPVSARFTTVDPIRDGSNWFSYVINDPVNYVDPNGCFALEVLLVKAGIGFAGGFLEDAGTQLIVNMASGQDFKEAVKNIDYKQAAKTGAIGAVTSVIGVPTGKTLGKTAVAAAKAVGTNAVAALFNEGVQIGSGLIHGQSLQESVANIDVSGVRNAYVSSAVTGSADKYVSSAVDKAIGNPEVYKTAAAMQNATSNVIGTVAGTAYANSSEGKPLTEGMGRDVLISAGAGLVSGSFKETGVLTNNAFENPKNSEVLYLKTLKNGKESFEVLTNVKPNETLKSLLVSAGQEALSPSSFASDTASSQGKKND